MPVIETVGLTKYYGKTKGIENVNLQVQEGEIFGFIGPNGAGKSTTIRTLLNFIFPTAGEARVLGLDVVRQSREIRAQVGYLAGEAGYYDDMKVKDLLAYAARFYKQDCASRIRELVDIFDLDVMKPVHSLSLGNKKKVGIVLSLLHQPQLLILDEPTSGLDPLMQMRFFEVLQEENSRGTTIFFSSHVLSEVQRLCHRVAIIKDGQILKIEEMEQLRSNQFRKVRIAIDSDEFNGNAIPGVIHAARENGIWHLLFKGDINQLLRFLSEYKLVDLWLEEPTLEEIFLHYYEKEGAE
ncbi:MAG TPA: ABC transporter [Firmicutes bacterium]|jgi:ABC-2 type transport system ATP-binding protein|nr:ABC transporter [Bacillota bacterium]HBS92910.1 ABC transporter [Bacillota bacterium]HCX78153.1 ABC transporter [Bacillota bacterium]